MLALHIAGKVLQDAPDEVFLAQAHEQALFSDWPLTPSTPESTAALDALKDLFAKGKSDLGAMRLEHLALFSGPSPAARPWESVWRERDKLLFGEQTMLVRKAYAEWGLANEGHGREPEDSISLEIAFCVFLLHRIIEEGDVKALQSLTDFLDEHLLQWAEPCLRKASESTSEPFYRNMPLLCHDALQSLRTAISSQ
jgi:TorA maturation chaperone TorD